MGLRDARNLRLGLGLVSELPALLKPPEHLIPLLRVQCIPPLQSRHREIPLARQRPHRRLRAAELRPRGVLLLQSRVLLRGTAAVGLRQLHRVLLLETRDERFALGDRRRSLPDQNRLACLLRHAGA